MRFLPRRKHCSYRRGIQRYFMREPLIKNYFSLSIPIIRRMVVKNRALVAGPPFERNESIHAWMIQKSIGEGETLRLFWIAIYDTDAPSFTGKFRFYFQKGKEKWKFDKFYNKKDLLIENDMMIQEMFLEQIYKLLDMEILDFPR